MAALTWGEFKTSVRRTFLKIDLAGITWSDDLLSDAVGFALDGLCVHTALAKTVTYEGDGETYQFELPTDVFVSPEQAGLVMVQDGTTLARTYLKPAYSTYNVGATDDIAFNVWPEDTLETGVPPPLGTALILRYYAYYPHPTADDDLLTIPLWAYGAMMYSTALHALTSRSLEEAENAADKVAPDRGQPENNSLRQLQKWWIQMYDRELGQYPKQNRIVSPR